MASLSVALDWSPNTNHVGFYVAKAKGWYSDAGLSVQLVSPHCDGYKRAPASRVADGSCDYCVTPSESVVSAHTQPQGVRKPLLLAVATLQQRSTSAVVTLKSSGLDTPAKLDGTRYASYGARYEGREVQELIRAAGGRGDFIETVPEMLGIWGDLLAGKADSTWVFMGWEGVEAARKGVELNVFTLSEAGIPYGYSPLLVADPTRLDAQVTRSFLDATSRGFQWAAAHPGEAAALFCQLASAENPDMPVPLDVDMCAQSMRYLVDHKALLDDQGMWGRMQTERWQAYVDWLHAKGLLTSAAPSRSPDGVSTVSLDDLRAGKAGQLLSLLDVAPLFTNAYLP